MDFQVPSKKGLHFEKVRRTGGQSSSSSWVLSCSHSGRGSILKGEGVIGIAWAFLAAGARSVLVTLWERDDQATMMFMKSFYQRLKEGNTANRLLFTNR